MHGIIVKFMVCAYQGIPTIANPNPALFTDLLSFSKPLRVPC